VSNGLVAEISLRRGDGETGKIGVLQTVDRAWETKDVHLEIPVPHVAKTFNEY